MFVLISFVVGLLTVIAACLVFSMYIAAADYFGYINVERSSTYEQDTLTEDALITGQVIWGLLIVVGGLVLVGAVVATLFGLV